MPNKLQAVTRNSLFDYLETVKDSEDRPLGVDLDKLKSLTDAKFYLDGKKAVAADHLVPETLFVAYLDDNRNLCWSVYAVHDTSVRFVEKDGDVVLAGIEFGTAWPTEVQYLMSGTVNGISLVIDYCWGYSFPVLDDLTRDLKSLERITRHFMSPSRPV